MTLPNNTGQTAGEYIGLITKYDVNDDFREDAACFQRLADLQRKNAYAARRFRDWMNYRENPRPETEECFAHALGLVRNGSRGRTHIIYQEVEYVPSVLDHLDQFRTTGVGVFKLEDVWQDIETRMGLDPGEGKVYIREMLEEFDHTSGQGRVEEVFVPTFTLKFSPKDHDQVYLTIGVLFLYLGRPVAMVQLNFRSFFAKGGFIHATQTGLETGRKYERRASCSHQVRRRQDSGCRIYLLKSRVQS